MCQYSSIDGSPSNWHYKHLANLILSGASMLIIESTAVSKIGRITKKDLCLYNNIQKKNFKKLIKFLKTIKDIPICLQISHSGRKGSCNVPWVKSGRPLNKNGWKTISSSNLKYFTLRFLQAKSTAAPGPHGDENASGREQAVHIEREKVSHAAQRPEEE